MTAAFNPAAVLLHSFAAGVMTYAWTELDNLPNSEWITKQKGGHFQFLTIQGLLVAWLTMSLSLLVDIAPSLELVRRAKRLVFMIALPLAVVISTIYWGLIIFMPHLILPPASPGETEPSSSSEASDLVRIPFALDLAMHALPGTALLLDFFLFEEKYPKSYARYGGAVVAITAATWYACWVEYCASHNGLFPYPFLTFSSFPVRIAIYAAATAFSYSFFLLINSVRKAR